MDLQQFVTRVNRRMGVVTDESDILGTIDYLAHFVPALDVRPAARRLPAEVVRRLSDDRDLRSNLELDQAPRELAEHVALPPGRALELFETVCRAIDDTLEGEERAHFRRNLPGDLIDTFERAAAAARQGPRHPNELASGRPGSTEPVAEADPAQDDSVARDTDPHDETKLSESSGMTQERKHRTLAEGEPGSTRSVSKPH